MSERLDSRIRELTTRLVAMSPEAPPFPEEHMVQLRPPIKAGRPEGRPRAVWAMVAALVVIAAIAVPAVLFGGSSDDAVDETTTTTADITPSTTTTSAVGVPEPDILGSLFGEPGQTIDITPPDQRSRGVGYTLTPLGSSPPTFWLIASAPGYDGTAQWGTWESQASFPDVLVTGPGPDLVVVPNTATPAEYLLCQADGAFCWTLDLVESTVRSFVIDPAAAAPVELVAAEVIRTGWGNGEFDVGLLTVQDGAYGPCCFDVLSDGGIVFLDEQNQRLMHWLPGGGSTFPLATFANHEMAADAVAVGVDGRIYVLGSSGRLDGAHLLLIVGLDGSTEGPFETVVDSRADLRATANGIYAGSAATPGGGPVDGWIPLVGGAGVPVPPADQQPAPALPVDDRSLHTDGGANGEIIATLYPGGDSLPIEYKVPDGYSLIGSFLQGRESAVVLVLGTVANVTDPAEFLVVRSAVEGVEIVTEVFRIEGRRWAAVGPFGTVRFEGSSLFFMSTTPNGTEVARYELPG